MSSDWDGHISADIALDGPQSRIEDWNIVLQIEHGGRSVRYPAQKPATGGPGRYRFQLVEESEVDTLRAILQDMRAGEVLVVKALTRRHQGGAGFFQVLTFPFQLQDEKTPQLPLEPFFILFEDPEYNRQLVSSAKHAVGLVKTVDNGRQALHTVTLATDRTEYTADGQLALRYDWDDGTTAHSAFVSIELIDAAGVSRPLLIEAGFSTRIQVTAGTLRQISLLELTEDRVPVRLVGGEALSIKLTITPGLRKVIEPVTIVLTVDVSMESVTPVPQAAYALLRGQVIEKQTQVECVRFAWSPPASRVELVCPDDLRTGIVRRRAVFLWTDTARTLATTGYAVQKLSLTGSTHFPTPGVLERVMEIDEGGSNAVRGWVFTGSMSQPRQKSTAVLLANGRVLVAGGFNNSSELYDAPTGSWKATGNTLITHREHTATRLEDGRVLIVGGGRNKDGTTSAELYNPTLGRWLSAGTPGTLRFNHTATLLRNGKVLVTGGGSTESGTEALATTELYDPATGTGTWTNTGGMSTARRFHTATLLNNGKVLIVGGNNGGTPLATAELYDLATGTFTPAAPMSVARSRHTATLLTNGQVLVTGGAGTSVPLSATAELYDPTTNTWSNTGRMTKPRRDHSAARLTDGKVLVAGGFHEGTGIQGNAELYDPATGAWRETLSMKVPRYQHTATLLPDGNVLVAAGVNNQNTPFAEFYVP